MIVKIAKIYLAFSLVLWAVWGHFQGGSLCLTCLLVSSVSDFHPDTRGAVVDTFFFFFKAHLFSHAVGREGCCKKIALMCACSVSAPLGLSLLAAHKSLQLYNAQLGTI